jgi:hypothetical protein
MAGRSRVVAGVFGGGHAGRLEAESVAVEGERALEVAHRQRDHVDAALHHRLTPFLSDSRFSRFLSRSQWRPLHRVLRRARRDGRRLARELLRTREGSRSHSLISRSSSSISRRLAWIVACHGSGRSSRASSWRPRTPKRSETGQGLPCVSRTACTRCFKLERWRTRCSRQRARSRSARTSGGQPDRRHEVTAAELG